MNKQVILDFIKFMRNKEGCEFMWQDDFISDPDDTIVFSPCSEEYLESCVVQFIESTKAGHKNAEEFPIVPLEHAEHIDELIASRDAWRSVALKFDNHRMSAIWHLKRLIQDPSTASEAEEFLKKPLEESSK